MVPTMGNIGRMTLREYLRASKVPISEIAEKLSVSEGAVHKWVYLQRQPSITNAVRIEEMTGGKVSVSDLLLEKQAAA